MMNHKSNFRFSPETKEILNEAYEGRCAICGERRKSPLSNETEAEAAHIHPAKHGGPDTPENGILLCKRCHWGFDSGWVTITPDLKVEVREFTTVSGHDFFASNDGREIHLPKPDDYTPDVEFIEYHRKLYAFDKFEPDERIRVGGLDENNTVDIPSGRSCIVNNAPPKADVVNAMVTSIDGGVINAECLDVLFYKEQSGSRPEYRGPEPSGQSEGSMTIREFIEETGGIELTHDEVRVIGDHTPTDAFRQSITALFEEGLLTPDDLPIESGDDWYLLNTRPYHAPIDRRMYDEFQVSDDIWLETKYGKDGKRRKLWDLIRIVNESDRIAKSKRLYPEPYKVTLDCECDSVELESETQTDVMEECMTHLIQSHDLLGKINLPYTPSGKRALLNSKPCHPSGEPMERERKLRPDLYLFTKLDSKRKKKMLLKAARKVNVGLQFNPVWG